MLSSGSRHGEVAVVHHDLTAQRDSQHTGHMPMRNRRKNFEVSIPFSEALKAKLFCALQKASEEIEMVR